MKYKLYEHRYTYSGNFAFAANCIRHSLDIMGWEQSDDKEEPDLHIYNHTCRDLEPDMPENSIIFKPTAPTSTHFQICRQGYANSSEITFEEPIEYEFRPYTKFELDEIGDMINRRANKWDDSILLKWGDAEKVRKDHILIIGQTLNDETVKGFGFGNHLEKLCMIIEKLKEYPLVIKLHPRMDKDGFRAQSHVDKWKEDGHQVFTRYESIHSILPHTRIAITENSTAAR